jgi:hypothetical protein
MHVGVVCGAAVPCHCLPIEQAVPWSAVVKVASEALRVEVPHFHHGYSGFGRVLPALVVWCGFRYTMQSCGVQECV